MKTPYEKCPDCGSDVVIRFSGGNNAMMLFNPNGTEHKCHTESEFEKHPIGQTVSGAVIKSFDVDGRYVHIFFEDENQLIVSASRPMTVNYRADLVGETVIDNGFQLRRKVLTLSFESGNVLTISAAGNPLTIRLEGPTGVMQE